jgi:hypothetical protein
MAAVNDSNLSLMDLAGRMGPDGKVEKAIIEILNEQNEALQYIPFVECNDGTSHLTTIRAGIPDPTWRLLNYGVAQTKSRTVQVRDACGMLENYSTVDAALCEFSKDKAALLLSEAKPIIEGMNQEFMSTWFYGNTAVNRERFMGLAPRYSALTGVENADNIITGGGNANRNTSIWIAVLGDNSLHGLFPEGTKAGLEQKNLGEQTVYDAAGNPFQAERSHFKWKPGVSLRDWRQVVRICNIDVDDLTKDAGAGSADLIDLLDDGLERIYNMNMGKPVIMANRTIRSYLRRQMKNHPRALLSLEEVAGRPNKSLHYDGIPIVRCDALLNTEATVA